MPKPVVLINGLQPPPLGPTGNGTFAKNSTVTASIQSSPGVGQIQWKLVSVPIGSACALGTTNSSTPPFSTTFGPLDKEGTYVLKAIANGDDPGSTVSVAVTVLTSNKSLRIMAIGEQGEWDPTNQYWQAYRDLVMALDLVAGGGFSAGGDLTGTSTNQTVSFIKGVATPTSAPSSGQFLKATDATHSTWATLSMSDITGGSLGGDVNGSFGATTVVAIRGVSTPGGAPSAGQFLKATSSTASTWAGITGADISSLAGDVTGPGNANTVTTITGSAGAVTVNATIFNAGAGGFRISSVGAETFDSGSTITLRATSVAIQNTSSTPAGTLSLSSGYFLISADVASNGLNLVAGAAGQVINMNASGAGGCVRTVTSNVYFQDSSGSTAITWNVSALSASSMELAKTTTWSVTQDPQTSDTACFDMLHQPQRAYASATVGNRTPGSFVVDVGAPTNGSTTEAGFKFKKAGVLQFLLSNYFSGSNVAMWLGNGVSPTSQNFAFLGDGSGSVYLNAPSGGQVNISTNGTSANGLNVTATSCYFNATNGSACTLGYAPRTTDIVGADLTVTASNAWASASTNTTGKQIVVKSGTNTDGTTLTSMTLSPTVITTVLGGSTVGTQSVTSNRWYFTLDTGRQGIGFALSAASQFIHLNAAVSSGIVYLDSPSINFRDQTQADTILWTLSSAGATSAAFAVGCTPTILQTSRGTDAATHQFTISAQSAWASASTNTTGGTLALSSGINTDGVTYCAAYLSPTSIQLSPKGSAVFTVSVGLAKANKALACTTVAITYNATMTPDASLGNYFRIVVTNGTAFTINNPTNPTDGQAIELEIKNASGGAMGAITWGSAWKRSAGTGLTAANITNGNRGTALFVYDGTDSQWVQVGGAVNDVPN